MSADKNALKTELNRVKKTVPILIVVNVVLGLAFLVAIAFILTGIGAQWRRHRLQEWTRREGLT